MKRGDKVKHVEFDNGIGTVMGLERAACGDLWVMVTWPASKFHGREGTYQEGPTGTSNSLSPI